MPKLAEVTLETIGGGSAGELFGQALDRVLTNIDDPNTDPKAVRKIQLTVTFKPSKSRESAAVLVSVKSTLAGVEPVETMVHITRDRNRLVAMEDNPNQESLPFGPPALAVADGGTHGTQS